MSFLGHLLVGWLLADLTAGIFHWWQDRIGNESWPILGSWLIAPQRLHHVKPLIFCQGTFLDRNLAASVSAFIAAAIWAWFFGLSIVLVAWFVGMSVANEVHRFTHEPRKANKLIKVLQEIGIVQSPKEHARHHRPPQTSNYCPLTDWVNPVLEAFDLWNRLERIMYGS